MLGDDLSNPLGLVSEVSPNELNLPQVASAGQYDFEVSPSAYFGPDVNVSSLPAGMRNNNPGNIKYVGQNYALGPSRNTDQGDPQAVFASPQSGMDAAASLALRKFASGKNTIDSLIAGEGGWTPGNHQAAANIASAMGVRPGDTIDLRDEGTMKKFLRGLVMQEHGPSSKLYKDDLFNTAAESVLNGAELPPVKRQNVNFSGEAPANTNDLLPQASPGKEVAAGGQFPTAPKNASGGGRSNLLRLMLLSSLGGMRLQPVDYDPYKVMPHFEG